MMTKAPLSKTQYGIYVESVNHQGENCYNLPYLYILDGSLDGNRLCRAVEAAVAAHPTLFTRIELDEEGNPLQVVDDSETFTLTVEETADLDVDNCQQDLIAPFNLYSDRLFRIRLLKDTKHYYLFIDYHHLIVDGTSMQVMLKDIDAAYAGKTLEPEAMTQIDVVKAEQEHLESPAFEEDKRWYAQNFDCGDTYTQLMPDLEIQEHAEAALLRTLDTSMERVDAFCQANGIFRSSLFTMAYAFLLAKFNNE